MTHDTSMTSARETDETLLYEIDAQSEAGREFQKLSTGPEKIQFLKENGVKTTKETGERIMIPGKEAWRHYNVGQLEYMFRADDDSGVESQLEKQCKDIRGIDEKKKFILKNATKIRVWPERIHRVDSLV
ncbi:hypothetical protein BTUL_0083g00170 [Botrytis tulipae]|uniref:Uncharacterized protein n=1 Tax=Botrytis tulipae TaxID=87230 RepID=A0A4Z1EJS4_9HELO|nr:hypothetical protein BTUL_0083g00170 [Botrytis tulipae]